MNTSSELLPKRAKTAALRQVQVCFHSAMGANGKNVVLRLKFKRFGKNEDKKHEKG